MREDLVGRGVVVIIISQIKKRKERIDRNNGININKGKILNKYHVSIHQRKRGKAGGKNDA